MSAGTDQNREHELRVIEALRAVRSAWRRRPRANLRVLEVAESLELREMSTSFFDRHEIGRLIVSVDYIGMRSFGGAFSDALLDEAARHVPDGLHDDDLRVCSTSRPMGVPWHVRHWPKWKVYP